MKQMCRQLIRKKHHLQFLLKKQKNNENIQRKKIRLEVKDFQKIP